VNIHARAAADCEAIKKPNFCFFDTLGYHLDVNTDRVKDMFALQASIILEFNDRTHCFTSTEVETLHSVVSDSDGEPVDARVLELLWPYEDDHKPWRGAFVFLGQNNYP